MRTSQTTRVALVIRGRVRTAANVRSALGPYRSGHDGWSSALQVHTAATRRLDLHLLSAPTRQSLIPLSAPKVALNIIIACTAEQVPDSNPTRPPATRLALHIFISWHSAFGNTACY
jgi:hypothetical protein